jgi:hypothetical protein
MNAKKTIYSLKIRLTVTHYEVTIMITFMHLEVLSKLFRFSLKILVIKISNNYVQPYHNTVLLPITVSCGKACQHLSKDQVWEIQPFNVGITERNICSYLEQTLPSYTLPKATEIPRFY